MALVICRRSHTAEVRIDSRIVCVRLEVDKVTLEVVLTVFVSSSMLHIHLYPQAAATRRTKNKASGSSKKQCCSRYRRALDRKLLLVFFFFKSVNGCDKECLPVDRILCTVQSVTSHPFSLFPQSLSQCSPPITVIEEPTFVTFSILLLLDIRWVQTSSLTLRFQALPIYVLSKRKSEEE